MSHEHFSDGLVSMLRAQAQWKADQDKLLASLTPAEKSLRDRFEKAIHVGAAPMELASITVTHPAALLAMAEAYRREGHETAAFTLVAIWMATRGHQQFIDHFAGAVRMVPMPPVPRGWWNYKAKMFKAMGVEYTEPPRVTTLPTPLTRT